MKNLIVTMLALTCLLLSSCSKDESSKFHGKTITDVDTLHTSITYENEYVRVVNVVLHPGEAIPAYGAGGRLIYSLSDYNITVTEDGNELVKHWSFGDIHWHDTTEFSLANNDSVDIKFSLIKRTEKQFPDVDIALLHDDVTSHSDKSFVLIENDQIKVVKVTLAPGDSLPKHAGINRLYIPQTSYDIICQVEDVGDVELQHEIGDYRFFQPGTHSIKNVGATEAVYLLVSFKK